MTSSFSSSAPPPSASNELQLAELRLKNEFGYRYDSNGALVSTTDGSRFKFDTQDHYDRLGDAIQAYVQARLQFPESGSLQRLWLSPHSSVPPLTDSEAASIVVGH